MEKKKMRTGIKVCLIISILLTVVALVIVLVPAGEVYSSCIGIDAHGDSWAEAGQVFGMLMIYAMFVYVGAALLAVLVIVWGTYGTIVLFRWLWKTNRLAFWIVLPVFTIIIAAICTIVVVSTLDFNNQINSTAVLYPLILK